MQPTDSQAQSVVMATAVADIIDNSISAPTDALIALAQIFDELPLLHSQRTTSRLASPWRNSITLFRARISWCGVGIDYVEHGGHLHIIDGWVDYVDDRNDRGVDCVLDNPEDPEKYFVRAEQPVVSSDV